MYGDMSKNFIDQEPPYVMMERSSSRGAGMYKSCDICDFFLFLSESNFDIMLETHGYSSDSSGSSSLLEEVKIDAPVSNSFQPCTL